MKTIKIITAITILVITLMAATCEKDGHEYIIIVNKSDKNIVYQEFFNDSRDSLFYCTPESHQGITILHSIKADSLFSLSAPTNRGIWEYFFHNESRVLFLFVGESPFAYDQYIPCDTIRKYVPVLHQYLLTLEDLERMNWTVVYPPEE